MAIRNQKLMPWQPHQVGAKESGRKQKQEKKSSCAAKLPRRPYIIISSPMWHQFDANHAIGEQTNAFSKTRTKMNYAANFQGDHAYS